MQTVYVDVLIFLNMFEDFLLLLSVKYILRLKVSRIRLIIGSAAGGLMSLSALLPQDNFALNLAAKITLCGLLSLITFGYPGKKLYIKAASTLVIITFLFNGALICFYLAFRPSGMEIINDTVYFDISPVLLIILTLIIYFILFLYRKLFKNHSGSSLVHDINILYKNNKYNCLCKTDSGCNLKEPFSGSSVIIIEKDVLKNSNPEPLRIIPYNSLGGNGIIYGFKPDGVEIDGKTIKEEIYVGFCEGLFKTEVKGLIPTNITEA